MKNILAVIPARYQSTRFPGKPLADIKGKPMIIRVCEQVLKSNVSEILVATDDSRIFDVVVKGGFSCAMIKDECKNGTERIIKSCSGHYSNFDFYINIQGDEPLIDPEDINLLIDSFGSDDSIKTLISPLKEEEKINPNVVKAFINDKDGKKIISFSRSPIFGEFRYVFKHIGVYGFSKKTLEKIRTLKNSRLEDIDNLEQIRWMESGIDVTGLISFNNSIGVDTPEDLKEIISLF